MIHVGISDEGMPDFPLKKLDNGYVVPDASVADIHRAHRRQTRNQVALAVEAEELGYDYVVHPEHHVSLQDANSPNPILTQTAVAAQTERIRLLQMANILSWHEPVRLAEQIGMLDNISDGRVEVGVGRSSTPLESSVFGQYWGGSAQNDVKDQQSFEEKFELLLKAWTEEFITQHGQFHRVPPSYTEWENNQEYHYLMDEASESDPSEYMQVDAGTGKTTLKSVPVMPQPMQKPHPQLWKPAGSARSARQIAAQGFNACCHCTTFSATKELVEQYHDATEEAGWPDHRPEYDGEPLRKGWDGDRRRGIAAILGVFNTDVASEETFERWKRSQEFALNRKKGSKPPEEPRAVEIDIEEKLAEVDAPLVGDTEEIIDQLATFWETCGYEDFVVFVQTKITGMSHEENVEQLRAFAEDVVPHFKEQTQVYQ
ncbi:LLM class flavin-dependent oxidoreductase [Haladaptatus cibarius]|uniref:LLM class flavin-dependent oxidoreductase n=1 Tax=Haladaptatus cibarius TaxID=453847 RepID=UPI00067916E8|nr:LLM class flavin-dependent oxidoreductase [Haladaptatus cibarius]